MNVLDGTLAHTYTQCFFETYLFDCVCLASYSLASTLVASFQRIVGCHKPRDADAVGSDEAEEVPRSVPVGAWHVLLA